MVFDVKYDLRHKARLVAGDSGVVQMDNERIGFFSGELHGLSYCSCVILGMPF
jgi:hypothetical protein